ncbi:hypothetical protein PI124_g22486 [Phytophthora idaei]|nr:hypothetical protein PI125_g8499 [Phytophthora idaei]KAG3157385.1 hypothetical protein PI126_g8340 [Phytophthora idaei]KAG3232431.1 hypothetical protein PI124_g22486 [Phytophthora idaei]
METLRSTRHCCTPGRDGNGVSMRAITRKLGDMDDGGTGAKEGDFEDAEAGSVTDDDDLLKYRDVAHHNEKCHRSDILDGMESGGSQFNWHHARQSPPSDLPRANK